MLIFNRIVFRTCEDALMCVQTEMGQGSQLYQVKCDRPIRGHPFALTVRLLRVIMGFYTDTHKAHMYIIVT